ncbi:hypothetical protein LCGC14_1925660 [marine sediment metagenome]|uniref:Glycosyl transferase family 1 domain-containing protein n=1 Tax=marine sediment metagenome TaxID=412755 RepID=A0A0F9IMA9_9ZZZZ
MKIAYFSNNRSFSRFIIEELGRHHTVKTWTRNSSERINWSSITNLLDWCDLAYLEWLQFENLEISQIEMCDKPLVMFCHGIDAFNHSFVDWRNVSGLIIQNAHYPTLLKLRQEWTNSHPNHPPLSKLPKEILITNLGVDLQSFTPLESPIPEYHIITHATLIRPTKRVYEAIQQFYDLIQLDGEKSWRMTLIGHWNFKEESKTGEYTFACRELIDRLNFPPGRLSLKTENFSKEMWGNFAKTADLYWCTSWRESFGASMAEVAASGGVPLLNHFLGAEKIYPKKYLCKTGGEMVRKTIEWGNLSPEEKLQERKNIRKHIEQFDAKKTAREIRIFLEGIDEAHRKKRPGAG